MTHNAPTITRLTGSHSPDRVSKLIADCKKEREERARKEQKKMENDKDKKGKDKKKAKKRKKEGKLTLKDITGPRSFERICDKETCLDLLEAIRWGEGKNRVVRCPHCEFAHTKTWNIDDNKYQYKCPSCLKQFNVGTDSMFSSRLIPIQDILLAIVYENVTPLGISSQVLASYMDISRKTCFELLTDIRTIGYSQAIFRLDRFPKGLKRIIVEADICFIDEGENKNRHIDKKKTQKEMSRDKVKILTIKVRGGYVKAFELPDEKAKTIKRILLENLPKKFDIICTDGDDKFAFLSVLFPNKHFIVLHKERYSVWGYYHTQNVERFHVEAQMWGDTFRNRVTNENKILHINAAVFKDNTKKLSEYEKLCLVIKNIFSAGKPKRKSKKPLHEITAVAA